MRRAECNGRVIANMSPSKRTFALLRPHWVQLRSCYVVPAYSLLDPTGSWRLSGAIRVLGGINNLLEARYFTKRPQFYPGPGVWPSDGRTLQLSVHLTSGARY